MSLRLFSFITTDGPIVVDMYRIGWLLSCGYSGYLVDVLVSLPQENRVCKASYPLIAFAVELSLIFMDRTDSIIMTLMIYCISTGLLTR